MNYSLITNKTRYNECQSIKLTASGTALLEISIGKSRLIPAVALLILFIPRSNYEKRAM